MTESEQNAIFAEWMKRYRGIIYKVARSFSSLVSEQEDLTQEITLAVWKSIPHFNDRSKAASYVYRIALNRAISFRRRERSHKDKMDRYEASLSEPTDSMKDSDERLELLYREIRRLDDLNRAIILLHLDGFTYQEIADSLGISISNVGVRINRIKNKMIENLNGEKS